MDDQSAMLLDQSPYFAGLRGDFWDVEQGGYFANDGNGLCEEFLQVCAEVLLIRREVESHVELGYLLLCLRELSVVEVLQREW